MVDASWREPLQTLLGSGEHVTVMISSVLLIEAAAHNGHFEGTSDRFRVCAESHVDRTFAEADDAISYLFKLLRVES